MYALLLLSSKIGAQNLVQNPSFEELLVDSGYSISKYKDDPSYFRAYNIEITTCKDWYPVRFESDVYAKNWFSEKIRNNFVYKFPEDYIGRYFYGVPYNYRGVQEAYSGKSYVGLSTSSRPTAIQNELAQKLEAGKKYKIEFWVSSADFSSLIMSKIGVAFSDKKLKVGYENKHYEHLELINVIDDCYLLNREGWQKVSATYTANGDEKYLIISAFVIKHEYESKTDWIDHKFLKKHIEENMAREKKNKYAVGSGHQNYYLDDVSLSLIDTTIIEEKIPKCHFCLQEIKLPNADIAYKYPNIYFGENICEINDLSEYVLSKLIDFLKKNKLFKIQLTGYSDGLEKSYKDGISLNRAECVKRYLMKKKIDENRIILNQDSENKLVSPNDVEIGREQNRRVEFILTQDEK